MAAPIGIYVHIPFCGHKCPYCDFYSEAYVKQKADSYVNSVIAEMSEYKEENISVDTIYFGGGTPSLMSPLQLQGIISAIKDNFFLAQNAEISMEANPNTLNQARLLGYANAGINRISIGAQSMNERELSALGRLHTKEQTITAVKEAYKCGITNISVDLMLSTPYQTHESLFDTLKQIVDMSEISHISAYMLTLEEGTPYYENETLQNACVTDDEQAQMYLDTVQFLEKNGFFQYEISNFAKTGFECRHNLKYWQDEEYLGFGKSAHSFYKGKRFCGNEIFVDNSACNEWLMLALRLNRGVHIDEISPPILDKAKMYVKSGYMQIKGNHLSFTSKGFLLSNTILCELCII